VYTRWRLPKESTHSREEDSRYVVLVEIVDFQFPLARRPE
jgi:hypothetical protein